MEQLKKPPGKTDELDRKDTLTFRLYILFMLEAAYIFLISFNIVNNTYPLKFSLFCLGLAIMTAPLLYKKVYDPEASFKRLFKKQSGLDYTALIPLVITPFLSAICLFLSIDALFVTAEHQYKAVIYRKWKTNDRSQSHMVSVSSWRANGREKTDLLLTRDKWHQLDRADGLDLTIKQGLFGIEKVKSVRPIFRERIR